MLSHMAIAVREDLQRKPGLSGGLRNSRDFPCNATIYVAIAS